MFNLLATNEVASVINLSGWVAVCLSNSPSDHWYSCNWNACDNIIVIVIVCCCFERATSCKLGAAACLQFSHSFPPISSFAAIFLPGSSARTLECARLKYARRLFATLAWFTNVEEPLLKPPICVHQHPQPEFYNPRALLPHNLSHLASPYMEIQI